tara:strand:+ start:12504 stop:12623 length:120 start_codon:yes stop_codon:yes gene_type:complete
MGTLKKKYKTKKENLIKLDRYLRALNNKTGNKVLYKYGK